MYVLLCKTSFRKQKLTLEAKFLKQNVFHTQSQYKTITKVILKSKHYSGNPMFEVPQKSQFKAIIISFNHLKTNIGDIMQYHNMT